MHALYVYGGHRTLTGAGSFLPLCGLWGSDSVVRLGSKHVQPLSQLAGPR